MILSRGAIEPLHFFAYRSFSAAVALTFLEAAGRQPLLRHAGWCAALAPPSPVAACVPSTACQLLRVLTMPLSRIILMFCILLHPPHVSYTCPNGRGHSPNSACTSISKPHFFGRPQHAVITSTKCYTAAVSHWNELRGMGGYGWLCRNTVQKDDGRSFIVREGRWQCIIGRRR